MRKRLFYWFASVLLVISVVLVVWQGSFRLCEFRPFQPRTDLHFLGRLHPDLHPDGHRGLDSGARVHQALRGAPGQTPRLAHPHQTGGGRHAAELRAGLLPGAVELRGAQLQPQGVVHQPGGQPGGSLQEGGAGAGPGNPDPARACRPRCWPRSRRPRRLLAGGAVTPGRAAALRPRAGARIGRHPVAPTGTAARNLGPVPGAAAGWADRGGPRARCATAPSSWRRGFRWMPASN